MKVKSKRLIEVDMVCDSCDGTGLYVGIGEGDGFSVVCRSCEGTGCINYSLEYEPFVARKSKKGIKRVLLTNPGIDTGLGKTADGLVLTLDSFGGMPFEDWDAGKPFPPKSEMREFACPVWWYQSENYDLKPQWEECIGFGGFSSCPMFQTKQQCWKKWDKENGRKN